ncbi:MAG: glycogen/starch synthase [Planctomycetaceae bacterium]|nr:glycogen/starch synthase [Planctomycetaceae bacterium]
MDTVLVFHFDTGGRIHYLNPEASIERLPKDEKLVLETALLQTAALIKERYLDFFKALVFRRIQMRISDAYEGTACLMPHDIALNAAMLRPDRKRLTHWHRFLVGCLERVIYHQCYPELHVTEARLHSLQFLQLHRDILQSTLKVLEENDREFSEPDWHDTLTAADSIVLLHTFWTRVAKTTAADALLKAARDARTRLRPAVKSILSAEARYFASMHKLKGPQDVKLLESVKWIYTENGSLILVYKLGHDLLKAVRLCKPDLMDAMSAHSACLSFLHGQTRTDLFHDHGQWLRPWIERLELYARDLQWQTLEDMLLSDDLHKVNNAIKQLQNNIRRKTDVRQSIRLLYTALYYWSHPDKGMCRSICLEVSSHLEDILTERPFGFPPSRINRAALRTEPRVVTVHIPKPRNIKRTSVKARIQWAVNGNRKKPVSMDPDTGAITPEMIRFGAVLPVRNGWIHYAVQYSYDNGKNWEWEELDENAHGLLKSMADERGQRVLSFYADTLNLRLDDRLVPLKDDNGLFVYGTFDDIAEQLEGFRKEGYTRIYPLGALELGWAGEAGPDPSVFSVWDGRTIRRDLGGIEALLRLRQKADLLGMKVLIDLLSHFSRANSHYAYHFPAYIQDASGRLTRRAGWDGEWSEWLDSFMVNMRDFENIDSLTQIGIELTGLGLGLRIDVGHGFDTVFPVDERTSGWPRLFGEVTRGGFEPIDLRKTEEPNIPILYMCYRIQKAVPNALLVYSEQWHGNEVRMIKSCTIPYNSIIKNMEDVRGGQDPQAPLGLNDNLKYLAGIYETYGGQTMSLFNSHDEESPSSNYQNMIWPAAAYLTLSSYGPLMYHISHLPGSKKLALQERFDLAYTECWKHWVNNRFRHPWHEEARTREQILSNYPILSGFGKYLRGLYQFVDDNPSFIRGELIAVNTGNGRIAAFLRRHRNELFLCLFNFPNPYIEGQQAVARTFNIMLNHTQTSALNLIKDDGIYEIVERYNNAEGRTRRGYRQFWSGHELMHLGLGGMLEPVSSRVYEFIDKTEASASQQLLLDSFLRYQNYGREYRVQHAYVASVFMETTEPGTDRFADFEELFSTLAAWIQKKHQMGHTALAGLLAEISEQETARRDLIVQYLMRIAVNESGTHAPFIIQLAADILLGMNLGTIALVSPESQFSGHAGGVGIYTTDIADVLSELGFHVVVVTPLYEAFRDRIIKNYSPRFDGHSFSVQFPEFDDATESIQKNTVPDVVNILRSSLLRQKHGKRSRIEVLYLENAKYLDVPYGGNTGEDKLRRARVLSQGALEALRAYNYYPTILQTNEWMTWLVPAYLKRWNEYLADPHFAHTRVGSMMHNPHPSYSIVMDEANPFKRYYYCMVLGLDAVGHTEICINPDSPGGRRIDMTYLMLRTSDYIGTVSKAMKRRMLAEPGVFGYAHLFSQLEAQGRFFGRRNGFHMAARQRFWFRSKKSMLETYDPAAKKRMFAKYTHAKKIAKLGLQTDPHTHLASDSDSVHHVIFSMLHRICKQKGFELLVDWKVYVINGSRWTTYEPWKMMGKTVLEYFLEQDPRIQFVICGRVEDSFDGRRYDMHFRRIASMREYAGRFAYFPEGSLPPALYRNLYVGSQYFVMPSGGEVGEPCGISQQEAHGGGTPVIAHHQDGLQRTVADRDFGDTHDPPNGIKFSGFTGESLLNALLDAVEIYYHNRRRMYTDKNGRPKRLRYSELSYNAFNTDHRWVRLLREYIEVYTQMAGIELPDYVDAVRLVTSLSQTADHELAGAILQSGLTVEEAADCLVEGLDCRVPSVQKAVEKTLLRLHHVLWDSPSFSLEKRLVAVAKKKPGSKKIIQRMLGLLQKASAKPPASAHESERETDADEPSSALEELSLPQQKEPQPAAAK